MLRIGHPDRHALLRITPHETPCPVTAAPSRASGFVLRRILLIAARPGDRLISEPQPALSLVGGNRSSCPNTDIRKERGFARQAQRMFA